MDTRKEVLRIIGTLKRIYNSLPQEPRHPNGHLSANLSARCATCGTMWMAPASMVGPEGYLDCCPNCPGATHQDTAGMRRE
jgi:hypothetical protein